MRSKTAEAAPRHGLALMFEIGNETLRAQLRNIDVPLP